MRLLMMALPGFRVDQLTKRILDIGAATIGLMLFSPLLLLASIAIKLDSRGPILVRETRYGYKNRPIQVLKFRLAAARSTNDLSGPLLTRVGRILSQSGIDDLPRLFNVLRGEMCIAGPHPSRHPMSLLNRVKPGMTGWAMTLIRTD